MRLGSWRGTLFVELDHKDTLIGHGWFFSLQVNTQRRRWVNLQLTVWLRPLRLLLGRWWAIGGPPRVL